MSEIYLLPHSLDIDWEWELNAYIMKSHRCRGYHMWYSIGRFLQRNSWHCLALITDAMGVNVLSELFNTPFIGPDCFYFLFVFYSKQVLSSHMVRPVVVKLIRWEGLFLNLGSSHLPCMICLGASKRWWLTPNPSLCPCQSFFSRMLLTPNLS